MTEGFFSRSTIGLPDFRFMECPFEGISSPGRLKGCSAKFTLDKRNTAPPTETTFWPGPRRFRQTYKANGGPIITRGSGGLNDHSPEACAGHCETPGRHRGGGPCGVAHGDELLRFPERDHRQRDPSRRPESLLRAARRRLASELLGDCPLVGRPELANLLLVPERNGPRPHSGGQAGPSRGASIPVSPRRSLGPSGADRVS